MIDTIGFDDPDKDDNAEIISELILKLKNSCDHVNLFIIAVNGTNPRLDGSLLEMIKIFEGMFGQDFWKQVVVAFTKVPMDAKSKKRRLKSTGQTDDQLANKFMMELAKGKGKDGNGYVFLDACYDEDDADEKKYAMDELYNVHLDAAGLITSKMKEVETKTGALKREIAEKEKAGKAAEEGLKEFAKLMQEEAKRVADLEKQLMVQRHEAEMNKQNEAEMNRRREKAEAMLTNVRARQEETRWRFFEEIPKLKEDMKNAGFSSPQFLGLSPTWMVSQMRL